MSTTKDYKNYVLEQLDLLDNVICRPMMGEYLLYYNGKLFGGIYDNRLLINIFNNNEEYKLQEQIPYKGAKPMYLVESIEDKEYLRSLILYACESLPDKK